MSGNYQIKDDRLYTKNHIWVYQDGKEYILGISDFAQNQLSNIMFIDLPSAGDSFEGQDSFGTIESVKSVNELYMPFSGEVIEINRDLEADPNLPNKDPYGKGWLIRIRPSEDVGAAGLLSAAAYVDTLV